MYVQHVSISSLIRFNQIRCSYVRAHVLSTLKRNHKLNLYVGSFKSDF